MKTCDSGMSRIPAIAARSESASQFVSSASSPSLCNTQTRHKPGNKGTYQGRGPVSTTHKQTDMRQCSGNKGTYQGHGSVCNTQLNRYETVLW